jgi:hypothetical protein
MDMPFPPTVGFEELIRQSIFVSDWDCRYKIKAVLDLATMRLPCSILPSQTPSGRQAPNADPATGAAIIHPT